MNRLPANFCLILVVLAAALLAACSGGQPTTNTSSPTVAGASPAQVSSSADVVKASSTDTSVSAGPPVNATINLAIKSGFHVNANPPTFSYLIPTEVTVANVEGITIGKPVYPTAVKKKFQFADQPLAVYEGDARVTLPISVAGSAAKGPRTLPITVRVQACDEQQCFPPATLKTTLQIEVK
jgi:DsbC/DsbD-like thiol-disulfide interchange protein